MGIVYEKKSRRKNAATARIKIIKNRLGISKESFSLTVRARLRLRCGACFDVFCTLLARFYSLQSLAQS